MTPLDSLALSRGTVDRLTEKRTDTTWLDAAWADPGTRVLVVSGGRALARIDDDERGQAALVFVPPPQAPEGTRFLLGRGASDDESADTSLLLRGAEASAYLWHELAAADLR